MRCTAEFWRSYEPGDVAVIQPRNLPNDVENLLRVLGWLEIADVPIQILPSTDEIPVPAHYDRPPSALWTMRRLLTYRLSVVSPPRRHFFELAGFFTSSDLEREKLQEFASTEGQEVLQEYCYLQKRTPLEVLRDFPNTRPPPEYCFDLFPEMKPRQFSIASDRRVVGDRIDLCVAIVQYRTKLQDLREGVCTKWMKELGVYGGGIARCYREHSRRDSLTQTWTGSTVAVHRSSVHPKGIYAFSGGSVGTGHIGWTWCV
ncbi:MAG: hypothetical protein BJ554DRAFT_62 [Olpidium bornovanus]|uniref:Sulfite reductase [NADPH] flavoprotein alpha-component-like FAD-binding domain-containing protein n=1 Tax=Olpidium bornovanus TaxID=278681 RepID=A0A8H7ZUA3_9FUNG|nr:MAG: hypothetical protein BJ554DRAFT_62 [Olpidium bornovanus]